VLDKLEGTDLSPLIHQKFHIYTESPEPLEAELIEVTELGSVASRAYAAAFERRRAFSIVLRGPIEPLLPQRIYQVEHPKIGSLDLFLVPIGPDEEGMRYEAVFN
jgi:hypothetical protein